MSSIGLEILSIVILIVANGVFSGSEIAVVSARKVRLEQLARQGNKKAKLALKLANSPNNLLSTVQIGITLIGILSGAVGGATLASRLETFLNQIPLLAPYSNPLSFTFVVSIITYLSLVIGELVPKRLALNNPEKIACNVSGSMQMLSTVASPIVSLLTLSTDGLLNLLGIKASDEPPVTEEEIKLLIKKGTQAGMFEEAEHDMVFRVFKLGDRPIKSLMTPRTSIAWLDVEAPLEQNLIEIMESPHSRFPVARRSLDNCIGIAKVRDLLSTHLKGDSIDLGKNLPTPMFVAESTRALKVLELFKETGVHIALVTDEYGGVEGLVTLNDIIEAIVGELPSTDDEEEPQIIQREDGSWLLDGMLSVEDLKELLQTDSLPEEEVDRYQTLGGFAIAMLRRIPTSGDNFDWGNFRFEVVDMDGTRVDKVLLTAVLATTEDSDANNNTEEEDED